MRASRQPRDDFQVERRMRFPGLRRHDAACSASRRNRRPGARIDAGPEIMLYSVSRNRSDFDVGRFRLGARASRHYSAGRYRDPRIWAEHRPDEPRQLALHPGGLKSDDNRASGGDSRNGKLALTPLAGASMMHSM
jgi:hypothetical protein